MVQRLAAVETAVLSGCAAGSPRGAQCALPFSPRLAVCFTRARIGVRSANAVMLREGGKDTRCEYTEIGRDCADWRGR